MSRMGGKAYECMHVEWESAEGVEDRMFSSPVQGERRPAAV